MAKTRIDDLAIVLSASTEQLASDLRAAAKLVDGFAKQVNGGSRDRESAKAAAREATANRRAARQSAAEWKKAHKGISDVASSAASALTLPIVGAAAIIGVESLAGAFAHLKESVNLAAELEQTTLAFEVMLKSADKAESLLGEIRKFASETPFNNAELTDSGRKLLAYGVAADQVVPTLHMLGDVAAATQTPIGDLAYLYGTLAAQQRAYSRDIYQFANRGIPIYEELAKVLKKPVSEVKDLVEEGRVGFPEVVKAFKQMTEAGGRYAGLTGRQANTFAGVREQLTDALQVGQIKLGKILIDELGLKEAGRDLTKFVESANLDRIRPFVRFVGDAARSAAQLANEFGNAALQAGHLFDATNRASAPELYKLVEDLKEFVKTGKDFKLNPLAIDDLFFTIGDRLTQINIDILKGIRDMGQALRDDFILPLVKGAQEILSIYIDAKGVLGSAKTSERFRPPASVDADEKIVERFRALWNEQVKVQEEMRNIQTFGVIKDQVNPLVRLGIAGGSQARYDDLAKQLKELEDARRVFLRSFGDAKDFPAFQHQLFAEGKVPQLNSRRDMLLGQDGFLNRAVNGLEERQAAMRRAHDDIRRQLVASEAQREETDSLAKAAQEARNSFAALAGGAGFAAKELASIKMPNVAVPWAIRPEATDAAKKAKEEFGNPVKEFTEKWNALSESLLEGILDADTYDRAAAGLLTQTGQKYGIGQTQLPDAAMRDTAESVAILNRWQSGQMKSEDFLAQILEVQKQQLVNAQEMLRRTGVPLIAPIPK